LGEYGRDWIRVGTRRLQLAGRAACSGLGAARLSARSNGSQFLRLVDFLSFVQHSLKCTKLLEDRLKSRRVVDKHALLNHCGVVLLKGLFYDAERMQLYRSRSAYALDRSFKL
jgi:hypothetical protein